MTAFKSIQELKKLNAEWGPLGEQLRQMIMQAVPGVVPSLEGISSYPEAGEIEFRLLLTGPGAAAHSDVFSHLMKLEKETLRTTEPFRRLRAKFDSTYAILTPGGGPVRIWAIIYPNRKEEH